MSKISLALQLKGNIKILNNVIFNFDNYPNLEGFTITYNDFEEHKIRKWDINKNDIGKIESIEIKIEVRP